MENKTISSLHSVCSWTVKAKDGLASQVNLNKKSKYLLK